MTIVALVRDRLQAAFPIVETDEGFAVQTPVIYPSNSTVSVYVSGGETQCVVTDGAGAYRQAISHGARITDAELWLKSLLRNSELSATDKGVIVSPRIAIDDVPWAVTLVARASARAAFHAVENHVKRSERDVAGTAFNALAATFGGPNVSRDVAYAGASNRSYRFDFSVPASGRPLLVDIVNPHPNSVNAKAVAHIDLSKLGSRMPKHAIVFDPKDDWDAADINLLKDAARLLPINNLGRELMAYRTMN